VKTSFPKALVAVSIAAIVSGCSHPPPPEPIRAVRAVEIRYDKTQETDRYFGSVQSRYEVDQAFRVGGKVVSRKVDVGQKVRQGEVIATTSLRWKPRNSSSRPRKRKPGRRNRIATGSMR